MPLKKWKKIKQTLEIKNQWWSYRKDELVLPSGKSGEYHYVHTNGSSMVIPVLENGKIILVKQYRYLAERESIEFVCGSVKDKSTHYETAVAELAEEAGFKSSELIPAGEFNPYNGITDEMCTVYIAKNLTVVKSQPDETEEFEMLALSRLEIDEKIKSGEIWDGMTLAAWLIVREKIL
ncbi:MAG: NUDIX hydrolase [Ignavibacteriales bacterium]|nr:NUDIX hydrolase [Ignavibacteriales bacterium]